MSSALLIFLLTVGVLVTLGAPAAAIALNRRQLDEKNVIRNAVAEMESDTDWN